MEMTPEQTLDAVPFARTLGMGVTEVQAVLR